MTRKFVYGNPIRTDAVTVFIEPEKTEEEVQEVKIPYGTVSLNDGFEFVYQMDADDIVYGLGEANRGINKRGYCYISDCADDPEHTEDKRSLYAAHNFIVIAGKENFGLFFDYPSTMTFDIGYTKMNTLCVTCENADLDLYVIEGDSPYDIVKQFRKLIGRSYIYRLPLPDDSRLLPHKEYLHQHPGNEPALLCTFLQQIRHRHG